jgi:HAD superfamily hydrolase (TIGR01450 family)
MCLHASIGHMAAADSVTLAAAARPLAELYDVALLDLDGVVYIGAHAVPHARDALHAARENGMRLAFVTNNAARTPPAVAAHLRELGIPADPAEVITSAQAAAHYLADLLAPGAAVLVVGTVGLQEALRERGLRPTFTADEDVAAVVQGYSPDLSWHQLAEGAVAIGRGVPWVATNVDPTVPSARGPLPGNGALVAALRCATGAQPTVTGKPQPTMHQETLIRTNARAPIVVGDRLDTDIEGANAVGCPSLLVLSGVTDPAHLIAAPAQLRPTYVAPDLTGLLRTHPGPGPAGEWWTCRGWRARSSTGRLELAADEAAASGSDAEATDGLDALRALCAAAWHEDSDSGSGVHAADDAARVELGRLAVPLSED